VNVALKVDFQFEGGKPAAALVMYKPRYITLPNDGRIIKLLKSRPDMLKGKYIVTEVISCAAYVMYMSDQSKSGMCRFFCAAHTWHRSRKFFRGTSSHRAYCASYQCWRRSRFYLVFSKYLWSLPRRQRLDHKIHTLVQAEKTSFKVLVVS
jgi:hypothetical protein